MELDINKIEKIRKFRGYTQTKFAELLNMSESGYKNLKKTGNYKADHLIKISEILGVSIQSLFTGSELNENTELIVEEDRVEYVSKIKELRKEIKNLEDRLKDKNEIIKLLKSNK